MRTTLAFVCLLLSGALFADEPPTGAKELFFDPQRENQSVSHGTAVDKSSGRRVARAHAERSLGLSYWIELADADGSRGREVSSERLFRSGDRIRLHFRGNADGHVVIVQMGTSGTATVLYPDTSKGIRENALRANAEHVLPTERVWFKFDSHAGDEKLLVFFAKTQAELDRVFHIQPMMDADAAAALLMTADTFFGGKDLIIETDTQTPAEVGTYAVNISGRPVVLQIDLKHQ